MALEIERKFLVRELPGPDVLGPGEPMRQGYLAEEGEVEVRLRITATVAVLTVKGGRGLARTEVSTELTAEQAEALWPLTAGRRIAKTRHLVPLPGSERVAEVDVYGDRLTGLRTVEVEFASVEAAATFEPPPWFGRDVTGEPGWSNAELARRGRPAATG